MKRFTWIKKGNEVYQFDNTHEVKNDDKSDAIVIDNTDGKVIVNKGNPITWPTDATDGLQAVVDVKAGTLRFSLDGPMSRNEFVVSEYVDSGTVPKPAPVTSAPHIFDLINYWPDQRNKEPGLDAPEGWEWKYFGDDWCLSNGIVGLKHDDWFKYKFGDPQPAKPFALFVSVEDCLAGVLGTKHDHGKPILGAVPPHAELAVGRVLTFGAEKYARGNWDKVEDHENRYMDAALRHLNAHRRGELTDSESGESHLAHAACCILFMLDKQERS
ncbi:hypothetical protein KLEA5_gp60 [Aeromonas phage vB_AveS_KLEA5]|nr:hypothetical protein KLEA5_gp60 [Aeromonas phage vB_AveS_KLEA5]